MVRFEAEPCAAYFDFSHEAVGSIHIEEYGSNLGDAPYVVEVWAVAIDEDEERLLGLAQVNIDSLADRMEEGWGRGGLNNASDGGADLIAEVEDSHAPIVDPLSGVMRGVECKHSYLIEIGRK